MATAEQALRYAVQLRYIAIIHMLLIAKAVRFPRMVNRRGTTMLLALAIAGCVPSLPRSRTWISDEVSTRTGATLRTRMNNEVEMPPGIRDDAPLTANAAVAIAMWNNADFQAELAQLGMARADLADAGVIPNPVATLLFPIGVKQLELTAKQTLSSIWQRPKNVRAAKKDAERVAETLVQRGLDLARDVHLAYANVLLAEHDLVWSREASTIWNDLLQIAEARLRSGEVSRREAEVARADARAAELAALQAETDAEVAMGGLRTVLGLPPEVAITLAAAPLTVPPGDISAWRAAALERPDLHAAELAIEAASERAGLERRRIIELVGILDINATGLEIGPGIEMPIPIFDHRRGGRIRAAAEIQRTSWQYIGLKRRITRDVIVAHARLVRAHAALASWNTDVLPAREEARRLALQAFQSGEEAHLVVLDATRALVDAKRRQAELEAEHRRAEAELVHATGGRSRAK